MDLCYNDCMKWLLVPITMTLLTACAATRISTGTLAVTGKSLGDHVASALAQADCDAARWILKQQAWYCERRGDEATRYPKWELE